MYPYLYIYISIPGICIHIVDSYRNATKTLKQGIVLAHTRIALNQWSTCRRFGQAGRPCLFATVTTTIWNILLVARLYTTILTVPWTKGGYGSRLNHCCFCATMVSLSRCLLSITIFIFECLAFNCYNSCRHGAMFSLKLVRFHTKRLATLCNKARTSIIWYRSNTLTLQLQTMNRTMPCFH